MKHLQSPHSTKASVRNSVRRCRAGTAGLAAGLLLLGLLAAAPAAAQSGRGRPPTRGKIQDAEIELVKERVNQLPEATRNFDKIKLAPLPVPERQVSYSFPEFRLPADRLNPAVRVLTIQAEEPAPLTGNYLKAGLGNYGTLLGRAHLHSTRNERYSLGADVRHESSRTGPVDGQNSGTRQTSVGLSGELYRGGAVLGANVDVEQARYRFYGYDPAAITVPEFAADQQVFTRVAARLAARSRDAKAKLHYEAGLGFRYFKDNYQARETNALLDAQLGYALSETSRLSLRVDGSLVGDEDLFRTNSFALETRQRTRTFFQATPAYELHRDRLALTLGATVGYSGDQLGGVPRTSLYPAVRAGYTLLPEKLHVYGGLGGAIQRVTRYDLSSENPWLGQGQYVADTHRGPTFYAGFAATPVRALELSARVTYSRDRNLYFYRNGIEQPYDVGRPPLPDTTRFALVYDSQATNLLNLHAELSYHRAEQLRLGLKADYNKYDVSSLLKPYGRPAVQGSLFGTYAATERLQVGGEFYVASATYGAGYRYAGATPLEIPRPADPIADLNLRGDYRITPNFSIFAQGNNVLGRQYQRYLNYPVKGIQAIGGATFTF